MALRMKVSLDLMVHTQQMSQKYYAMNSSFAMVKDELECDLDTDLLTDLDALYIDARYPGDLGLLPDGKPTLANAH